ncbi:MAG TPA: hypothetical protein VJT75_00100 [Thermoleophilaceae bacterium]|nr:hypothetical protein [Thermoleophilaceae bacterium]
MKKSLTTLAALAALAVPAIAIADDPPSQENKQNAQKFCRDLREASGKENFRAMFGGGKNAFGKCVSQNAKKDQAQEERAHTNAAKECKAEREADAAAFAEKYGEGKNHKNAYGKCVSQHAKANKAEEDKTDANDVKAAKACKTEKAADKDAFAAKYGTNGNKRNAFGKCVSQNSKKLDDQDDDGGSETSTS